MVGIRTIKKTGICQLAKTIQGKIIAGGFISCESKLWLFHNCRQLCIDRAAKINISVSKQSLDKFRTIGHQCKAGVGFQCKIGGSF